LNQPDFRSSSAVDATLKSALQKYVRRGEVEKAAMIAIRIVAKGLMGVDWLKGVLRRLAGSEAVELTSASDFVELRPPETVMHLPEGSWGAGGTHFVWDNLDTHWMWPVVHEAEGRMSQAVRRRAVPDVPERTVLDQAARELLLLQSSDWPFLVTTGQAREYAIQRFRQHVERFNSLLDSLDREAPDTELADRLWERDKVFPDIDARWFRA